jgi:hypothetical protein
VKPRKTRINVVNYISGSNTKAPWVADVVLGPLARRAVVAVARLDRGSVERVDRRVVRGREGDVHVLGRLAVDERERALPACEAGAEPV